MSSTSNGCEKPTYGPARMEQQVSMVSRPRTMRRTSRRTFGTSWSASNLGTIKRHRYAEPTSPSLTVRNGHSEFQPSKTRWHREQSLWYWRLFMSRTFCHAHGFRPGRSAHQALNQLSGVITVHRQHWVLDVDIRKYFDSISHSHLREILDQRVTDGVVRRMIDKWLNAGVLEAGTLHFATEGTPQGGVISPMLSNIFLHYVLDAWFEGEVKPRLKGKATLVRFADDFVMTFETYQDAKRVMDVLGKRLGRFGLTLHPDKTHFIDFRPQRHGGTPPDCKAHSFDFLGFTHAWAKSRKGKNVVRQTTAKNRIARSLATVKDWCRTHRHLSSREQHAWLTAVLNGHFAYYGITGNIRQLQDFRYQVVRTWHKWLARRTRGWTFLWNTFNAFLARHPLPAARIVHRYA